MGRGMVWFSVFGTVEEDHMWLSRVPPSSARPPPPPKLRCCCCFSATVPEDNGTRALAAGATASAGVAHA